MRESIGVALLTGFTFGVLLAVAVTESRPQGECESIVYEHDWKVDLEDEG